ncbi:hypothetical protein EMWEY_00026030 [Eimeria maxima]|uniref:Uncharacterized protein n=1 Tax=Eimeria maxima TaxID=5804 RepID=U6M337_EIMMA|nr:hypothetical protein EMWEY_00026030 [Eimeria maxima]CDJ56859.1 hypothetical protein EMWEY_00026030 [Eimeria maxima]
MGIVQGDDNLDARPSIVQTPQPLSEESKGYLRDGNLLVASNVVAVQTGQIKDQHSTTLSFAAVAFFVRQCSIGLQATQASVTPRQLAEAPGISPELTTCQGEDILGLDDAEFSLMILDIRCHVAGSDTDVSFAFKVENFVVRAEVDAQSREAGPVSITRVIRTPRSVEHWIQLIIRHAEGKEREANPKVVYEWAQDVLKFTEEKKAKLLVGSLLYKLKYKVIEAAHEVQSNWDRAETMILDSARTGRKEVFSVAAEKRNAKTFHMAIVQIKMREASWKEQRRLRGHPTKDATGRTSWIQRGGGPYDVSDWVEFSLKGPPTPPPLPTPSLPMPPFPAPSLPTSYIPPPPPSQPLRPAQPTNPGDLPYLDELKSRLSSGSLGSGGAQGQTGGAQGQTGGAQGQTGGDQGQTGGAQGQTGGAQGQTGGAQGQTGGAQGQTGGAQDQTRRLSPAVHPGPSGDAPAVQLEPSGEGAAESGSQGQSPP